MVIDEEQIDRINEAASRGAAFLDQRRPGWAKEINTQDLEMVLPCNCILGQLGGEYTKGFHEIVNDGHLAYGGRAKHLGFLLSYSEFEPFDNPSDDDAEYDVLTDAWKEEIAKRL